ncbi:GTP-binding protein [Streptomyces sp. NPDC091377]|uniref:GTP-binding protein n=1 Tax=Streptomyces sp. NPDC091377 TaxID=3365995 RepID=UPI003801499A
MVAGGFGVGKTTFVGAVSDVSPLRTDAPMTSASEGIADLTLLPEKTETTVTLDFGRRDFPEAGATLFLFGTPGQDRFRFMWDELAEGAVVAIVLADTRRLDDSFPVIDYFERRTLPFLIAVNTFPGSHRYSPDEVREALALGPERPVLFCDARRRASATKILADALDLAIEHAGTPTSPYEGVRT